MTIRIKNPRYARELADAILPEEPVWQGKWRNLWFLKDGSCRAGLNLWNSEEESLHALAGCYARRDNGTFEYVCFRNEERQHWDNISHAIPMPSSGGE